MASRGSLALIHPDAETAKAVARMEFGGLHGDVIDAAVQRMIDNNVYPGNVVITAEAFANAIEIQQFIGKIHDEDIVDASFTNEVVQ